MPDSSLLVFLARGPCLLRLFRGISLFLSAYISEINSPRSVQGHQSDPLSLAPVMVPRVALPGLRSSPPFIWENRFWIKGTSYFLKTLTCFVLGVIKLHVKSMTIVDDSPRCRPLVGNTQRLQLWIMKGCFGVYINRGLVVAFGNGKVLVPVLGS